MAYSQPYSDSPQHVIDLAADAANLAVYVTADADIYHNRFNGYSQHQLRDALAQVTRLRAVIATMTARQVNIAAFIATLEALTP